METPRGGIRERVGQRRGLYRRKEDDMAGDRSPGDLREGRGWWTGSLMATSDLPVPGYDQRRPQGVLKRSWRRCPSQVILSGRTNCYPALTRDRVAGAPRKAQNNLFDPLSGTHLRETCRKSPEIFEIPLKSRFLGSGGQEQNAMTITGKVVSEHTAPPGVSSWCLEIALMVL